ncbi:MAG: hypothetical protein IKO21_09230 [Fibrobacter sp.]|nr:hypothetical protein [Fibrobacter sp.]
MIKRAILSCLVGLGIAFADLADPNEYTSGAGEPATPVVNINHVENDEPMFAVSIHPISMFILSLIDVPSVFLTIEGNLGSRMSLITRPNMVWADFTNDDEGLDVFVFGISEGLRAYMNEGHRGLYADAHFVYNYVSMDYSYDRNPDKDIDAHLNGFGFALYLGHKFRSGFFTTSFDVGYKFVKYSASKKEKEDLEDATAVGSSFDINYTFGVTF